MDDNSCALNYIEIVPLDNSAEQFEDVKPVQVKVCVVTKLIAWVTDYEMSGWSIYLLAGKNWIYALANAVSWQHGYSKLGVGKHFQWKATFKTLLLSVATYILPLL